jgi:hypothetical protein
VAFYSYTGLRLCDLRGNIVAEVDFPEPLAVKDRQYDAQSGNVAVLYEDALRLYSGFDGSLLLERRGKPGVTSVFYTEFGVSVLAADGAATLYDLASGGAIAEGTADPGADCALPFPGERLVTAMNGQVFFDGSEVGPGALMGAGEIDSGYIFAISDGASGAVFTIENGVFKKRFAFEAAGVAEAYFTGGFVFISPTHGDAAAYTLEGAHVRAFEETGFLAETFVLGEYIAAGYVSAAAQRYTLLLDPETLQTAAFLPGFLGEAGEGSLILNAGGSLRRAKLLDTQTLVELARGRLSGRTLTPEEIRRFNAG